MFLVGDIGGTHARLALARAEGEGFVLGETRIFESARYSGLEPILEEYLDRRPAVERGIRAAAFGLPGPVLEGRVRTTNLPWEVDARLLRRELGVAVALLNDLEAIAHGTLVVPADRVETLQEGEPARGNRAVIAAGTGLGEAALFRHGDALVPSASEGGHTEFGPRDEEEIDLLRFLLARHGHVSYERIVSGPGLVSLHAFYRERVAGAGPPLSDPAEVTHRALAGEDPAAVAALSLFCSVYGAEAGNLALKVLAREGVWVAGGIAPRILPFLRRGGFLDAFRDKGRYWELMARIPVHVVLEPAVGLLGAARAAALAARTSGE